MNNIATVMLKKIFISATALAMLAAFAPANAQNLAQRSSPNQPSNLYFTGDGDALALKKLYAELDKRADAIEQKVIAWRRDLHQNPELGNREFRTSKLVAEHLKNLGLEVKTGVAHTGVVAILKGAKPGATIALRADMDGLPVTEESTLPFVSKARGVALAQIATRVMLGQKFSDAAMPKVPNWY